MAIQYGVTATGYYAKPLSVVDDEIDAGLRTILGESAGTSVDGKIPTASMAGQLKALLVDGISAQWDQQEAIAASFDPSKTTGALQDAVCSITGTIRNGDRLSVATGLCIGTPLTALPVGRVATVAGTTSRFATATGLNLATGTAWVASSSYLVGVLRYVQSRHYLCIATGIAGASGPSGVAADITDNQVHWKYLGDGIGIVHAPFFAEVPGAIGVATGSLNAIATPISGWNAVSNLLAGQAGELREADSALRNRRDQELATTGNTTVDAIRANVLRVNEGSTDPNHLPPVAVTVFNNDTDAVNSDGLPPHSIEAMVQGGTAADIAQAIWDSVGAGTATYGSTSSSVIDSEGNAQTVRWTRPAEVQIWVTATGRYDSAQWPAGSDSTVAQTMLSALLTFTANYPAARDARSSPLMAAFMRGPAGTTGGLAIVPADPGANAVPGLLEVDPLYLGIASGPTGSASVVISRRQIAVFDASRCVVTASSETP